MMAMRRFTDVASNKEPRVPIDSRLRIAWLGLSLGFRVWGLGFRAGLGLRV